MSKRPKRYRARYVGDEEHPPEDILNMVFEEMNRVVSVKQNGTTAEIKTGAVVFGKIMQTAMAGSPHSQRLVMDLMAQADSNKQKTLADEVENGRKLKEIAQRQLDAVLERGEDTLFVLPHPDDIIINPKRGVHYIGPIDDEELEKIKRSIRLRDLLILQDALDQRMLEPVEGANWVQTCALIFAMMLDNVLPERFRLSESQMEKEVGQYQNYTKRTLLKEAYQGWKSIGAPKARGYTTPLYALMKPKIDFATNIWKELQSAANKNQLVSDDQLQTLATAELQRFNR